MDSASASSHIEPRIVRCSKSENYRCEVIERSSGIGSTSVYNWHCRAYEGGAPYPPYTTNSAPPVIERSLVRKQPRRFPSSNRQFLSKGKGKDASERKTSDIKTTIIQPRIRSSSQNFDHSRSQGVFSTNLSHRESSSARPHARKRPSHRIIYCEFQRYSDCQRSFALDDVESWIQHTVVDHLDHKFPRKCLCWFCDNLVFQTGNGHDRKTNFYRRMWHVHDHLVNDLYTISDMRPDHFFLDHLYEIGAVSAQVYSVWRRYQEAIFPGTLVPFNSVQWETRRQGHDSKVIIVDPIQQDGGRQQQLMKRREEIHEEEAASLEEQLTLLPETLSATAATKLVTGSIDQSNSLPAKNSEFLSPGTHKIVDTDERKGSCEHGTEAENPAPSLTYKRLLTREHDQEMRAPESTALTTVIVERSGRHLVRRGRRQGSRSLSHSMVTLYYGFPLSSSHAGSLLRIYRTYNGLSQNYLNFDKTHSAGSSMQTDALGVDFYEEPDLAGDSTRGEDRSREGSRNPVVTAAASDLDEGRRVKERDLSANKEISGVYQHFGPFRRVSASIRRLFWPKLPSHLMRASWICRCGQYLYIDFHPSEQQAAIKFAQAASGSSRPVSISSSSTGHLHSQAPTSPSDSVSSTAMAGSDVPEHFSPINPKLQRERIIEPPCIAPGSKKFLLLCVNTGRYEIKLEHIDLTNIQLDVSLFTLVRESYNSMRGPLAKNLFMVPKTVEYIKFELLRRKITGECVGNYVKNSIPGRDEVMKKEYELAPYPPRVGGIPIQPHIFMHSFHNPGDHLGGLAVRQLPKKLGRKLKCVTQPEPYDVPFGWGVYITEGVNTPLVSFLLSGVLLLITVIVLLWSAIKDDIQGGTGIGQYALAAVAMAVAIGAMRWKPLRDIT